ncbi:WD repeat domain phosphoinositide-interacting protein 2 [Melipona quadrifasciata]|uniref:WD repeat domain phosphoinositide-interacting protein 2 n=1 Tax=Melipona quadrifasciata TaxID=166423 RepID=A0A0N0U561_9HYME|nr:WD repeat domain phosphoinositide-interacting protein 2 [Melipona quadrifasciata]
MNGITNDFKYEYKTLSSPISAQRGANVSDTVAARNKFLTTVIGYGSSALSFKWPEHGIQLILYLNWVKKNSKEYLKFFVYQIFIQTSFYFTISYFIEYNFIEHIKNRLVVCLEESLYIHNIRDMKVLHTIRDTPPNLSGLCTLSINSDNCYLAYPGSNTIGEVQIFDAINLQAKTMIPAHDSPLAALAFSPNGTKVATASEKGTVIRVFNVNDGTKLFEFRRGVKRCVSISSLAFSIDCMFLCCSSNTETVHIFKLEEPKEALRQTTEETQGWMGYLTKAVSASANYLPSQVTDVFTQGRAFASVHLPFQGLKNVCAITIIHKVLRLLVASAEGYLYVYNLDSTEGGDYDVDSASVSTAGSTSVSGESTRIVQNTACINSYAGVLRGRSPDSMSESEKYHEMIAATESPPGFSGSFRLKDDAEFPPVT